MLSYCLYLSLFTRFQMNLFNLFLRMKVKKKKKELAKHMKLVGISLIQISKNISNFVCRQSIVQYL